MFAGAVAILGGTFFNIFVSGVQQSWNDDPPSESNKTTSHDNAGADFAVETANKNI